MKRNLSTVIVTLILCCAAIAASLAHRLTINNMSDKKIIKVLASSDGQSFAPVASGTGIKPSQSMDVRVDPKKASECTWQLKAIYADRSEWTSQQFDICDGDVTIDFH